MFERSLCSIRAFALVSLLASGVSASEVRYTAAVVQHHTNYTIFPVTKASKSDFWLYFIYWCYQYYVNIVAEAKAIMDDNLDSYEVFLKQAKVLGLASHANTIPIIVTL